ncbi:hypothetical protein RFI_13651, partial [Reticulomyxa filosa]
TAARRAKQVDPSQRPNRKGADAKKKSGWMSKMTKRLGGDNKDLTEEELLYLKAQQEDESYKASVMTANHEQGIYVQIQQKFKQECHEIEIDRMNFCVEQVKKFTVQHKEMFTNETILVCLCNCQFSSLFFLFLHFIESKGPEKKPVDFVYQSADFQNPFYSLKDAMEKIDVKANVPRIMTSLCQKVIELDGLRTEGIFRISAATSHLDALREDVLHLFFFLRQKK